MKSIQALQLMKKYNLIHKEMRLRDLKFFRKLFGHKTWPDFIKAQMMAKYLTESLENPITIPEIKFSVGGTLSYDIETGKGVLHGKV